MTIDNYFKKSERQKVDEIAEEFLEAKQFRNDIYITPCIIILANMDYQHAQKNIRDYLYFNTYSEP